MNGKLNGMGRWADDAHGQMHATRRMVGDHFRWHGQLGQIPAMVSAFMKISNVYTPSG